MTPVPAWLRGYDRSWLPADVVAGLIVWSVVTPQAVAYAQIAGLPPVPRASGASSRCATSRRACPGR